MRRHRCPHHDLSFPAAPPPLAARHPNPAAHATRRGQFECEDCWRDAQLFDAVGTGLGLDEMYNVMLAVKRLGEDPTKGIATVRFMGKFLGLTADYYVFETTMNEPPEEAEEGELRKCPPPLPLAAVALSAIGCRRCFLSRLCDAEPLWLDALAAAAEGVAPMEVGTGTNGYIYWVCNYLGGPVTMLPSIKPAEIKAARTLKKFLTGKLDAPVSTFPPFPGNEATFLRAQIARIVATTVICPAGIFQVGEEDETTVEKAEEYEPLPSTELLVKENWVHRYPHLKKQGRCVVFTKEVDEEEEEEAPEPTEEESEEGPELLATLEGDAPVGDGEPWTPVAASSNENVKFQVAAMRSNLWPGAVAAAKGADFANIYVGWGLKNAPFTPQPPPPVATEFDMAAMESTELPPKPEREEPPAEDEEEPED